MKRILFFLSLVTLAYSCTITDKKNVTEGPPNIILIVADGLGFSDLGHFGSEINTPNLDLLAEEGLILSEFYNAAGTCQTHASLFTGLYPGQTGLSYNYDNSHEGCTGTLDDQCTNLAEILKTAGYHTLMAGNWLLNNDSSGLPASHGFDRYYIHREGENHISGNDAFTDTAVNYIMNYAPQKNPYFLLLSYTRPEGAFQDPDGLARYKGKYDQGWEAVRDKRFLKLVNNGLLGMDESFSPQDIDAPVWDSLSPGEKALWEGAMETYAAIIDHMDQGIGKIITALEESGEKNNTLVIFISGNPGSDAGLENIINPSGDSAFAGINPDSLSIVFRPWARVLNTPFYKGYTREGGISSPFIASWPDGIDEMSSSNYMSHVIDIMPTLVEVSGATYPEQFKDHPILPMEGISLVPLFTGEEPDSHEYLLWEFMGSRAIRMGDYKIVADRNDEDWILYDIAVDRCEQQDLSEDAPQEIRGMKKIFKQESERVGIME